MSEKINVFVATPTYDRTLDLGFVDSMWVIKENQLTKKEYNENYIKAKSLLELFH